MTRAARSVHPPSPPLARWGRPLAGWQDAARRAGVGPWARFAATFASHFVVWLAAWALLPILVGWRPIVLASGSMMPVFQPGDVVVVEPVAAPTGLGPGTVVVFLHPGDRRMTTHRVVDILPDGTYLTKGDANPANDTAPVRPDEVMAVGRLLVPLVGLPYLWAQTGNWPMLLLAFAVVGLAGALRPVRRGPPRGRLPRWLGRARRATTVAVVAALFVTSGRVSSAAFSATAANVGNSFAAATTFCDTPGSQTVTSVADTHVVQEKPTDNFGTETTLTVKDNGTKNRRVLVRFTLPTVPAGCAITAATLRLYSTAPFNGGRTYQAWRIAATWTEGTVTWNTQPGTDGTAATTTTTTGWVGWTVTTQVQQMYAGSNYGFLVRDSVEGDGTVYQNGYSSREGANAPQLVVTWG